MIFWSQSWILVHFSTLNSLARLPIYLSCGTAYALATFFGRHRVSGLWKRIKDEWIVVSLGKDERPKLPWQSKDLGQLNIGLEGIRLDNCQWKEGVFIEVLACMNLTEWHRMAIPWDPINGLHIVGKERGHQAIYKVIEEVEAGHRSSPFKDLPVQLRLQWSDTIRSGPPGVFERFQLYGFCLWYRGPTLLKPTPVGNELGIDKPYLEFEGT